MVHYSKFVRSFHPNGPQHDLLRSTSFTTEMRKKWCVWSPTWSGAKDRSPLPRSTTVCVASWVTHSAKWASSTATIRWTRTTSSRTPVFYLFQKVIDLPPLWHKPGIVTPRTVHSEIPPLIPIKAQESHPQSRPLTTEDLCHANKWILPANFNLEREVGHFQWTFSIRRVGVFPFHLSYSIILPETSSF